MPDKVITVPVHQQVGPDGAVRFAVNTKGPQSEDETVYMYRVRLTLLYDTGTTPAVQVGELISNSRKLQRFFALDGEKPGLGAINTTISTKP